MTSYSNLFVTEDGCFDGEYWRFEKKFHESNLLTRGESFGQDFDGRVVRVERLSRLDVGDEEREGSREVEQQYRKVFAHPDPVLSERLASHLRRHGLVGRRDGRRRLKFKIISHLKYHT